MQRAFLQNLFEHDIKFPFAMLFGGRKHRNKFNFFSESKLGCGPQDPVEKFSCICHFKRDERKAKKFFFFSEKKTNKERNKETKEIRNYSDSSGRFRCPGGASWYDQIRKSIG